jgi:nucleotide-binding universal stress UspA family protein
MSEITRLLVATDLTERSQRAFERGLALKSKAGASLTLLHAVEPGLFPAIGEERYADAEEFLHKQITDLPEDKRAGVGSDVQVGEPFTTIIDEAHKLGAELIVLGQPAKSGFKELFTGTTTDRVVRFSDLPVLVVKDPPRGAYESVLVAMDLSEGAIRALEAAYRIAPDAQFLIVHAWHEALMGFGTSDAAARLTARENKRVRELVERKSKEFLSRFAPRAKSPRFELIEGNPQAAIRNQIAVFDPDLLAMGTHARSPLKTATLGSLARELLAEAPCDVLVVRA